MKTQPYTFQRLMRSQNQIKKVPKVLYSLLDSKLLLVLHIFIVFIFIGLHIAIKLKNISYTENCSCVIHILNTILHFVLSKTIYVNDEYSDKYLFLF